MEFGSAGESGDAAVSSHFSPFGRRREARPPGFKKGLIAAKMPVTIEKDVAGVTSLRRKTGTAAPQPPDGALTPALPLANAPSAHAATAIMQSSSSLSLYEGLLVPSSAGSVSTGKRGSAAKRLPSTASASAGIPSLITPVSAVGSPGFSRAASLPGHTSGPAPSMPKEAAQQHGSHSLPRRRSLVEIEGSAPAAPMYDTDQPRNGTPPARNHKAQRKGSRILSLPGIGRQAAAHSGPPSAPANAAAPPVHGYHAGAGVLKRSRSSRGLVAEPDEAASSDGECTDHLTPEFVEEYTEKDLIQELMDSTLTPDEFVYIMENLPGELRRMWLREVAMTVRKGVSSLNISNELELDKTCEAILEETCTLLQCESSALYIVEERNGATYMKKFIPDARGNKDKLMALPFGKGIAGHVVVSGDVVIADDALSHPAYNPDVDFLPRGNKPVCLLAVPILEDSSATAGLPVGVLVAMGKLRRRRFTVEDEHILRTLSAQAALSLRNSLRYESALKSENKVKILLDVAKELTSELEINSLIKTIMKKARILLEADRCTLFLVDKERNELMSKVADGSKEIRVPLNTGIAGHVAATGMVLNIPDAYKDPRFNPEIDKQTGYRTRTILCMPLSNTEGEIVGVTQMINKKSGQMFGPEDEDMLSAFSAQAAVAIENSKLFHKMWEMRNYLESILRSITHLVLTLNEDGRLLTANHPVDSFLGLSTDELKRKPYHQWFSPGTNDRLVEDIARVCKNPQEPVYVADYTLVRQASDGSENSADHEHVSICVNYNVVALWDWKGVQKGVVVIIEDISPQKRILTTLGRYMSPVLAEQVIKEGGTRLGGVHQKCVILFADIRDFTALSETMDAADVVILLNEYFTNMGEAVDAEEGIVNKYIGDSVMAVFGVPFPKDDDSVRACRCALLMRSRLEAMNDKRRRTGLRPIEVGIGINTGRVLSGNIGSEKRLEYTVIGDGVNLASRIESATKQYKTQILLTEFTYSEVAGKFLIRELDYIRVVGKQQPIRIYELLDFANHTQPPHVLKMLASFEQGLAAYKRKAWDEAICHFSVSYEVAKDYTSMLYLQRCNFFKANPPDEGWDGVWHLAMK